MKNFSSVLLVLVLIVGLPQSFGRREYFNVIITAGAKIEIRIISFY